jgi:S-methylmethionine-dependent homocysteine/selenocysteine methylase
MVRVLADAGVDLLLCETFPHAAEALIAVQEAVATDLETWVALTAGPAGDLMTPGELADAARRCAEAGASACLVNCVPAVQILPFVESLLRLDVAVGAYANAGASCDGFGWSAEPERAQRYAALARRWVDAGVTIVGGCCGTGPQHIAQLAAVFGPG